MINNEEDLESFMKSLENDLESITKKEEGKNRIRIKNQPQIRHLEIQLMNF